MFSLLFYLLQTLRVVIKTGSKFKYYTCNVVGKHIRSKYISECNKTKLIVWKFFYNNFISI